MSLPQYTKQINQHLHISIEYVLHSQTPSDQSECIISLHNVLNEPVVVNPSLEPTESKPASGWFGSIFGGNEPEKSSLIESASTEVHVFLGYVQLLGYVVLNYNFDLANASNPMDMGSKNPQWWENSDYVHQYENDGTEEGDDHEEEAVKELKVSQVPFIQQNSKKPLVLGDKLGGVNDLTIDKQEHFVTVNKKYFLHDLLYTFNSHRPPKKFSSLGTPENEETKLPLSDLTESILPFYTTSQALLFSDVSIPPASSKSFSVKFHPNSELPPSYNARLTGPVKDHGWISIKYSLIVGFLQSEGDHKLVPYSVYFPYVVRGERVGNHDRWLQMDYLQRCIIDKAWQLGPVESPEEPQAERQPEYGRSSFLDDLSVLIDSDLYNMPKITSHERRKSIINGTDENEEIAPGLIAQLPSHLKTQYQLRVNNAQLCLISVSRPYYHIGDDIKFTVNLNPEDHSKFTKITGFVTYIEAHEMFHSETETSKKDITNVYTCTPRIKFNTFGSAIMDFEGDSASSTLVNGTLHIPRYLTQQFQASTLMSLKYYMVFKFNLLEMEASEDGQPSHVAAENSEPLLQETEQPESYSFDQLKPYKFNNNGTELRFRLPLVLLP
ncbi:Rgp1-domain-containing protein [Suhomyces tanzawaensis NRRL Y-17324]|uniref:Rgp1-domain-containing protein n=1 Tax=Suhomyces tanzawaensis NRRL Y-17324 TaxID=984487 RepID=A0A1E4SQI9_9ASCO|nr:Rgp1-domain-containing protein [Suhomyces tanzawaensis NRRL Y-17324]ODV81769.1 Rgp1-domain-containing protein [Suhomyces tanzawaensis NRRL Y-17324]